MSQMVIRDRGADGRSSRVGGAPKADASEHERLREAWTRYRVSNVSAPLKRATRDECRRGRTLPGSTSTAAEVQSAGHGEVLAHLASRKIPHSGTRDG